MMKRLSFVVLLIPLGLPGQVEIALQAPAKLGGCAVGDLDPRHPGNEIAAVSITGEVHVVRRGERGWTHETVFKAPGELIQCAIGDLLPERPGHELLAVGMATGTEDDGGKGAAYVVFRDGSGWKGESVFVDDALIHGGCIGQGDAIVVGYTNKAHRIRREGGTWKVTPIADLPSPGKAALATPRGAVVACTNGALLSIERDGSGRYAVGKLDQRNAGRSRLGGSPERVAVAVDDGVLSLVTSQGREAVHREPLKLRGAVLADLDPHTPGLEAASAGYTGQVTLLRKRDGKWHPQVLFKDLLKLHHLVAGDVDGRPGLELITCGYTGRLVVMRLAPR